VIIRSAVNSYFSKSSKNPRGLSFLSFLSLSLLPAAAGFFFFATLLASFAPTPSSKLVSPAAAEDLVPVVDRVLLRRVVLVLVLAGCTVAVETSNSVKKLENK
jgi:hypothetical protein